MKNHYYLNNLFDTLHCSYLDFARYDIGSGVSMSEGCVDGGAPQSTHPSLT